MDGADKAVLDLKTPGSVYRLPLSSRADAVSVWTDHRTHDHAVHVFQGGGSTWTSFRVIGGSTQVFLPYGLRFTADGTGLVVARGGRHVGLFQVTDGSFVRHLATELDSPRDVEEWEGRWMVACSGSLSVEFVGGGEGGSGDAMVRVAGNLCSTHVTMWYTSRLAMVPGVGLVVKDVCSSVPHVSPECTHLRSGCSVVGRSQAFTTPDVLAMASVFRSVWVLWMVAAARAVLHRHHNHVSSR